MWPPVVGGRLIRCVGADALGPEGARIEFRLHGRIPIVRGAGPDIARSSDYYLPQLVGYPMETAVAVSRLIFSGLRERHPFALCLAHGGGCLPWLRGRLDLGWERKEVARTTPSPPSAYVRDLYVDTAVFSDEILSHLVADLGAGRVLLGTDFPFELADRDPLASIAASGVSAPDARAITWDTAAALLGLSTKEAV